jgi:hypothetical protein
MYDRCLKIKLFAYYFVHTGCQPPPTHPGAAPSHHLPALSYGSPMSEQVGQYNYHQDNNETTVRHAKGGRG